MTASPQRSYLNMKRKVGKKVFLFFCEENFLILRLITRIACNGYYYFTFWRVIGVVSSKFYKCSSEIFLKQLRQFARNTGLSVRIANRGKLYKCLRQTERRFIKYKRNRQRCKLVKSRLPPFFVGKEAFKMKTIAGKS